MKQFNSLEDKFKYYKQNKDLLIVEKKSALKKADAISFCNVNFIEKDFAEKSENENINTEINKLKVKVVINTTNLFDSHEDVHIPGIWKKTLKDRQIALFLQEHEMKFDKIITDKAIPTVKNMMWSNLGYNYIGSTQALIFDAEILSERNDYMFGQYKNKYVTNHSVGMQYVNLFLCINSTDKYFADEKANWDKYITYVANIEDVKANGLFWAVTEAKLIEGSAVVMGSNFITPTLEINEIEPSDDTQNTDSDSRKSTIDVNIFRNEFKNQLKQII